MQITVIGCGKIGRTLIAQLSREGHNITAVDRKAELVREVAIAYDIIGVVGNGASYTVLQEADLEHTDMLIAVTESDEVNLLCCVIAKKKGDCRTIARVRNPVYSAERDFLGKGLELAMVINPELETAREISRLLRFPNAIEVDTFSRDRIDMLRFRLPENSFLDGCVLKDMGRLVGQNVLVCMAEKQKEIIIPDGRYKIENGDILTIIAEPEEADSFFEKIGVRTNRVKNAMIIGGGGVSYYLIRLLLDLGMDVKVIERNRERCEELCEQYPEASIECGDGSDRELLEEERIEDMDALVACTGIDEINVILALYAQEKVRRKVVTKVTHMDHTEIIEGLQLDSLVNPKDLTAESIMQFVRALENSANSNVERLYRLKEGRVEALQFNIGGGSDLTGVKLKDMQLKKNTLVAGIVRHEKLVVPGGQDEFQENDSVIIVTTNIGFRDVRDILAK